MRKCSDSFGYVQGGLVNWSSVFVEAIFESSFCFTCVVFDGVRTTTRFLGIKVTLIGLVSLCVM